MSSTNASAMLTAAVLALSSALGVGFGAGAIAPGPRSASAGEVDPSYATQRVSIVSVRQRDADLLAEVNRLLPGPGPRPVRAVRSERFIAISECDETWTRERLVLFERTFDQFEQFCHRLGVGLTRPSEPMVCVLLSDPQRYTEFARASGDRVTGWAGGFYSTRTNRIVFYDDRNAPDLLRAMRTLERYEREVGELRARAQRLTAQGDKAQADAVAAHAAEVGERVRSERERITLQSQTEADRKAIHEAVHLLAFNTGLQLRDRVPPLWVSEGLASAFETDRPEQAFGPGVGPRFAVLQRFDRGRTAQDKAGGALSLRALVTLTDPRDVPAHAAEDFYAQSLELFEHLHRSQRQELAQFFVDLAQEPAGPITGERLQQIFEARFGPIDAMERSLARQAASRGK